MFVHPKDITIVSTNFYGRFTAAQRFPVRGVLGLGIAMLFFGHQDAAQQ